MARKVDTKKLSPEIGISQECLAKQMNKIRRDMRSYLFVRLSNMSQINKNIVLRRFGGYDSFFDDMYQDIFLLLCEKRGTISERAIHKYVFWSIKELLRVSLYTKKSKTILPDFEVKFRDEVVGSFVENTPEIQDEDEITIQDMNILKQALNTLCLSEKALRVLDLYYYRNIKSDEVCKSLGITDVHFRTICYQTRSKIRNYFESQRISVFRESDYFMSRLISM